MAKAGEEYGESYWKEKYLQMEAKMSQFHLQASDIRKKLAVKITTLTDECEASNKRADKTEHELEFLKEKMKANEKEKEEQILQLQKELKDQKGVVKKAEESLKHEIEERNEERTLVHQRVVRLKDSIAARLEEVEDQKKLLFEANERATSSLYEMQRRVQELTTEVNELKQSTTHSSVAEARNNSTHHDDTSFDFSNRSMSPISQSMDISMSPPPVPPHADKVIKRSPRRREIESPTAKDGHVPFPLLLDDITLPHDTSNGTTSETGVKHRTKIPKSKAAEISVETIKIDDFSSKLAFDAKKKKKSATLPKTRSVSKKEHSTHHHSSLIETFGSITRKFRGFTDSHQNTPASREIRRTQSAGKKESKLVRTASGSKSRKHISTPQISKDLAKIKPKASDSPKHFLRIHGRRTSPNLSDTLEEEEDPNTSSRALEKMEVLQNNSAPASTYLSTSLPSPMLSSILPRTKRSQSMRTPRKRPPTPPSHRVPVWETKIYNLSKTGFQLRGSDLIRTSGHDAQVPIRYHSSKEKTNNIYKRDPPEVPVYSKLFGKVVLLRNTAFPELSEWSDDDDLSASIASELSHLRSCETNSMIPLRKTGSPGQGRAVKRANSSHSVTSSEGDYSIPPDAVSLCSESSEPEHKLYKTGKTGAPAAASSRVSSSSASPENGTSPLLSPANLQPPVLVQEKSGFLYKLSSYSLTWRKRWFVLKPNKLQYYLSPADVGKKPIGEIQLNAETKLDFEHGDDSHSIFHLSTEKKTLYISADAAYFVDDWIRALNITLNRPRTLGLGKAGRHRSTAQNKIALKGWIERLSKDGKKRKLWACLGSSSLYFHIDVEEREFVGRMVIKDCKISPAEDETSICVKFPVHNGQQRADVLLLLSTKMEKDAWLFWLTVASGTLSLSMGGNQNSVESVGTAYERLVTRIMYVAMCTSDSKEESIPVGASSPLWRNPTLSFCRESEAEPLTTLSSEALNTEAVKLIKFCQRFMNSEIDSSSVDFHVTLAQRVASTCLAHQQLQGEIYAQLIKQCNGKFTKSTTLSPKHSSSHKQKTSRTDDETAVLQIWKLLSLIIPLFLPHQRMLWLLKAHLHRHADDKTEIGQYAAYCQRALARVLLCGGRTSPPSRTETVSILLQNPFHHSLPFSIPVHFHNGKYQVMSFDASSTVGEFTQRVCQQAGVRLPSISGFSLITDDPNIELPVMEHYISVSSKICDIISEWERSYRESASNKNVDTSRMVKVSLAQHLTFATSRECETEKEKILITYQASSEMASDRFPVGRDLAIELSALCAQMDEGDMRSAEHGFKEILEKFYPKRYLDAVNKQQLRQLRGRLCERWALLKAASGDCARVYLNSVRECPIYGAKLFEVEICKKHKKGVSKLLAVHESGVDEVNRSSMEIERKFAYSDIATYGGCDDKLFIAVETDGFVKKHVYSVALEKAAEMVHLVTEYMQAKMARK